MCAHMRTFLWQKIRNKSTSCGCNGLLKKNSINCCPKSVCLTKPARFYPWWRHQMEIISALLDIFAGNSPAPAQRPVTRSFDVFFDMRLNKRLIKQWRGWWFETLSPPLWRLYNTIWQWGRDIPGIAAVDATVLTPCQCRLMTENTNTRFSNIFQNHSADTAA